MLFFYIVGYGLLIAALSFRLGYLYGRDAGIKIGKD